MGLAICKEIITKSGGTVNVFSKGKNKGSTFIFTMKMAHGTTGTSVNQIKTEARSPTH